MNRGDRITGNESPIICTAENKLGLDKEGRKEGTYLFDQTTIVNTIHIYENAMVRRLSLRLNIAASATATEIIIIII